jgi:hyperosmotically inducible protein
VDFSNRDAQPSRRLNPASQIFEGEDSPKTSFGRTDMYAKRLTAAAAALLLALSIGCSQHRANTPSEKNAVADALKQAGYDKISIDEDRDKGVITLKGDIATQADKERAETIARESANNSVIANELLVTGADKGLAKEVAGDNDDAIKARFKEWVAANRLKKQHVSADVKNGVVTLTGDVDTEAQRTMFEKDIAKIEGVTEVVNKLEVKPRKNRNTSNPTMPGYVGK